MSLALKTGWAHPPLEISDFGFRIADFDPGSASANPKAEILMGWSLGALQWLTDVVTQKVALPAGIVLLAGMARFCSDPEQDYPGTPSAALRAMTLGMRKQPARILRAFFKDAASPVVPDEHTLQRRIDHALALGDSVLLSGLKFLAQTDLRDRLAKVDCPCLVLHGDADRIVPCATGQWLAKHLPHARFLLLRGAGHNLPLDHAAVVAKHIRTFIGDLS